MNKHELAMANEYIGKQIKDGNNDCGHIIHVGMGPGPKPKPYVVYGVENEKPTAWGFEDNKSFFHMMEKYTGHKVL